MSCAWTAPARRQTRTWELAGREGGASAASRVPPPGRGAGVRHRNAPRRRPETGPGVFHVHDESESAFTIIGIGNGDCRKVPPTLRRRVQQAALSDLARRLEGAGWYSASFWLRRQAAYDESKTRTVATVA